MPPSITGDHKNPSFVEKPRRRVLVVEDDADTMRIINRIIGSSFDIVEATTGDDALQRAADGVYDLLIYDPGLPGSDDSLKGLRLLVRLYAVMQPIRVLAVSGDDMTEIRESGLFDFLQKPLTPAPLRNTIDQLMASPTIKQATEVVARSEQLRPAWMGISGVLTFIGSMVWLAYDQVPHIGIPITLASFGVVLIWVGPAPAESFIRLAQALSSIFKK